MDQPHYFLQIDDNNLSTITIKKQQPIQLLNFSFNLAKTIIHMKHQYILILACILLVIFEIIRVYFIMPMPGSQQMNSIHLAYFLHKYRWVFRVIFYLIMALTLKSTFLSIPKTTFFLILIGIVITYITNYPMSADTMFKTMNHQDFSNKKGNLIDTNRLIIGVVINNEARAYPINIIAHHHQVKDKIGGKNVLVTYCSVCRTGRVYEPIIDGKVTDFRLVGMDHFNAMFEDPETGSWWRQVNGKCIIGKQIGKQLPELQCYQTTLKTWLQLYPNSLILQQDKDFEKEYKDLEKFDDGTVKSKLIGRNTEPNQFKSWVVWVKNNNEIKSFDWSMLEQKSYIIDKIGLSNCIILSNDKQSIFAFSLKNNNLNNQIDENDWHIKVHFSEFEITTKNNEVYKFDYHGNLLETTPKGIQHSIDLQPIECAQEFKHSYQNFQLDKN